MKLHKSFLPLLAIAAMTVSCTSDEELNNSINNAASSENYLSVKIATSGTRAATYEDGSEAESKINTLRFYFFDANGNSAMVKKGLQGGYQNYIDWTSPTMTQSGNTTDNITSVSNVNLLIETPKGDKLPAQMVVVANSPDDANLTHTVASFNQATRRQNIAKYKDNGFFMTNATYLANNKMITAVDVTDHFAKDSASAVDNPATVVIERAVAKVNAKTNMTAATVGSEQAYKTAATVDKGGSGGDVYVKFIAWDLSATTDKSYVLKEINPAWESHLFYGNGNVGEIWNDASARRSYWAVNPSDAKLEYKSYTDHIATGSSSFDLTSHLYCEENAATGDQGMHQNVGKRTQMLVAAQLIDEKGQPLSLVEFRGLRMRADKVEDDGTVLETELGKGNAFINYLLNSSYMKSIKVNGNPLTAANIDFIHKITDNTNLAYNYGDNRYAIYVQLKGIEDTDAITYQGEGEMKPTNKTLAGINEELKAEYGEIKYWNEGHTYYHTEIRHLGNLTPTEYPGAYGVVRNHVYNISINSVAGLGTPVYDTEKPIVPEDPTSDETFLAAKIEVLAWRIVDYSVDF